MTSLMDDFFYFPKDRAILIGIDKDDASFLLSVVGIANTLGRIVLGFLSDRQWINRLYLYNMSLAICGLGEIFTSFQLQDSPLLAKDKDQKHNLALNEFLYR